LIEGNFIGKFGSDGYHGSGSHTLLFRNMITGSSKWPHVTNATAIQIDRRNLDYSIVGNVLGRLGSPATLEYARRERLEREHDLPARLSRHGQRFLLGHVPSNEPLPLRRRSALYTS
jgi:hypothetical protein